MQDPALVLRDIHPGEAPAWWPPAPGWWLLMALALAVAATYAWWQYRRRSRTRRIAKLFDDAVGGAREPALQVAAMSELLRRAAHRRDPQADTLQGEAWLAFLDDGEASRPFSNGWGRLLLEGPFRREVDPAQVAALREVARQRFLAWVVKQP
jgi:hypothetical protein